MAVSMDILIWNKETDFIKISEGTGDNLLWEDKEEGYVDYMMIDGYSFNGDELEENYEIDGGQAMLYELYQEKFNTTGDVIKHLIDCSWIPDVEYTVLYEK